MMTRKKGRLSAKLPSVGDALELNLSEEEAVAPEKEQRRTSYQAPSRAKKKGLVVYVEPEKAKNLRRIALEEDSSIQAILETLVDRYLLDKGYFS